MNTLAIQTCFKETSVALCIHDEVFYKETKTPNMQNKMLPIFVKEILQEAKITAKNLNSIAICHGPGTFTGIRIGTAFAKGLAIAHKIPIFAISALEATAPTTGKTSVAIKALKETVYFQTFQNGISTSSAIHITEVEALKKQNLRYQKETFPTAKDILQRFLLFPKTEILQSPLYIRPIEAKIAQVKNIT